MEDEPRFTATMTQDYANCRHESIRTAGNRLHCRKCGRRWTPEPKKRVYTDAEKRFIFQHRFLSNWSLKAIADALGREKTGVAWNARRMAAAAGIELPNRVRLADGTFAVEHK